MTTGEQHNIPQPNPHASKEEVAAAYHDTKLAQVLYHDWEAQTYDDKWSISFDERCISYARDRFDLIAPAHHAVPYERALELGSGTGFFLLNLMLSGVAKKGSVTDISPGMVKVAQENARKLHLDVDGRVADAEKIPYDDNTFDLVVGHAILHHIPDVKLALEEVLRVLKPGGVFVFAGEPSTIGNKYARAISTWTWKATIAATRLPGLKNWRRPKQELDESSRAAELEAVVDIHTFDPDQLIDLASQAGATNINVEAEELAAALFGWPVRTFECAIKQGKLSWNWAKFAYGGWKFFSKVDRNILRTFVPKKYFYNLLITGTKR